MLALMILFVSVVYALDTIFKIEDMKEQKRKEA